MEKEKQRLAFARAVFAHWVAQVQKKKRNAKAKERKRRLKAQREQSINGGGETASDTIAHSVASTDQVNCAGRRGQLLRLPDVLVFVWHVGC